DAVQAHAAGGQVDACLVIERLGRGPVAARNRHDYAGLELAPRNIDAPILVALRQRGSEIIVRALGLCWTVRKTERKSDKPRHHCGPRCDIGVPVDLTKTD